MYDPTLSAMYARPIHVYGYNVQDIQFTYIEQTYVVTYIKMLSKYEYFFLYCLCKLQVICRENGYLMEIYTLDFLKSNSQYPLTIMYWI